MTSPARVGLRLRSCDFSSWSVGSIADPSGSDLYAVALSGELGLEGSRYHSCVPEENLVGKAEFVWMSLASLDRIATPIRENRQLLELQDD